MKIFFKLLALFSDRIYVYIYGEKIKKFSVDERDLSPIISALSKKLATARKQDRMIRVRYNVIHSPLMGNFFHNTLWLKHLLVVE